MTSKPTKPTITIPASFAINGAKADFDATKLSNGFHPINPDVFPGDVLNKFVDDLYKTSNYALTYLDYLNEKNIVADGSVDFVAEQKGINATSANGLTTKQQVENLFNANNDVVEFIGSVGTLNLIKDKIHTITPTTTTTIVLPTGLTFDACECMLKITNSSGVTISQPSGVKWKSDNIPVLSTSSEPYTLIYWTVNAGTTWEGAWLTGGA